MAEPIRIANASGFFGDRLSAAREMVDGGPIDVLTGDYLAELTMYIFSRTRERRPDGGFARSFVGQMGDVLGDCLDRGIKVVSNAGALDPHGCADAVRQVAEARGWSPRIAVVTGDDLLPRLGELIDAGHELAHLDTGEPLGDMAERMLTANAYLGGWGITEALRLGADVVITGRVTDAAVVVGPAAWHHGWDRDDWDALAGAAVAGHVIECGAQATGGNYSFFTELADLTHAGFPWAEVAEDGSCVIGKHDGTGGAVSVGTVTSQLLYEIGGHRYANPDVVARFDTLTVTEEGADRVRVAGAKGEPAPETLKVAMNYSGGWKNSFAVGLTGLDIDEKVALVEDTIWDACAFGPEDFEAVNAELVGRPEHDPSDNAAATCFYRITVRDQDPKKVGRAFSSAAVETALSSIPGFFGLTPPGTGTEYPVYWPTLVPADVVDHEVHFEGTVTPIPHPEGSAPVIEGDVPWARTLEHREWGETEWAPLGSLLGARSGDKGPNANLGVFTRNDEAFWWMLDYLTVDRLVDLLPDLAGFPITRHEYPRLRAVNFVVGHLLEEGVGASTRVDAQAKGLSEYLRARHADIPARLLDTNP